MAEQSKHQINNLKTNTMKPKPTFKSLLFRLLIAGTLVTLSSEIIAQEQGSPDLKDFKITIEKTDNGLEMHSSEGSAWINLSIKLAKDTPQAIDEYGMTGLDNVSPNKDSNLAEFLFTITITIFTPITQVVKTHIVNHKRQILYFSFLN